MKTFIESSFDWLLDQEEKAASHNMIHDDDIDKQIAQVTAKKEQYQQKVKKTLDELDHILMRLQAIKAKSTKSGNVAM